MPGRRDFPNHSGAMVRLVLVSLLLYSSGGAQHVLENTIHAPSPSSSSPIDSPRKGLSRPTVALVLSGGGARGLAQVGVLRAFEQHRIPIDLIVGNSLGSVVGGLYAAGYSVSEIESIAANTDWSELLSFSEDTKRTDLFVDQKQSPDQGYLVIRFDGLQPIIPSSISSGQRLSNYFSYLTLQALYHPRPSFDDLKIPYRAIATDLLSGKRIILDRGSLAEAMRASVTVPLLYSPIERDSMFLVDGGLMSNIPVDVARSLGYDIVIAVNSTSSLRHAEHMEKPWEIADQIMSIMMFEANERQLAMADVVITPETGYRIVSDFSGIESMMRAGEIAAGKAIPAILDRLGNATTPLSFSAPSLPGFAADTGMQKEPRRENSLEKGGSEGLGRAGSTPGDKPYLSNGAGVSHSSIQELLGVQISGSTHIGDSILNKEAADILAGTGELDIPQLRERILKVFRRNGYSLARIESSRLDTANGILHLAVDEGAVSQIRYEGNHRTRDYIIRREFPLDEGEVFNIDRAARGLVNIKSTGLFDYVLLDVRYIDNKPVVVLKVKERSSEQLRLGLRADNEHGLMSAIEIRDENFRGASEKVALTGQFGPRDRVIRLDYTINRIFHTYLTLNFRSYFRSRDVFVYGDVRTPLSQDWDRIEIGKYKMTKYGGSLSFGSQVERFGNVLGELRVENQAIAALSGEGYSAERYRFVSLKLQSTIDTEDRFYFPRSGMMLKLGYESASRELGSEVGFGKFTATYETFMTFLPRHTVRPRITFGYADETLPTAEQFTLGGYSSFYGLLEDDSYGRQLFLVNLMYRHWLPFSLIFDTYVRLRYDLGTISRVPEELKFGGFRHGLGIDLALDTPLGPASFGVGRSFFFRKDVPGSPVAHGPFVFYFSFGPNL